MSVIPARVSSKINFALTAPWSKVIPNRVRQITHPGRKVFLIGPNRCATTTFHNFFHTQGLKSIHWRRGPIFLAREIDARRDDIPALRDFLSRWTVFSDFVYLTDKVFIENHVLYETYARAFPEAYFILNDRNVDRWVNSRLLHRDGGFMERFLKVRGGTHDQAIESWKDGFLAHREAALSFFKGHPRFLHFNIDKEDHSAFVEPAEISRVIDLLRPDYKLDAAYWTKRNVDRRAA